ncbi:hypothetical protein NPIL_258721, partial [Nephila pilipes]
WIRNVLEWGASRMGTGEWDSLKRDTEERGST